MKFVLCCTLVPEKYEIENKAISNAANRFLTNLTNQMKKKHSLKILSYIGVNFDAEAREELQSQKDDNIRYYFKSKGVLVGVFQMLCAIWKEMDACDYAITYNVVYAWMLTPIIAKLKRKKSVLILADYSPVEAFVGKKQQLYARVQRYFMGQYDYVIGLSEKTKRYLKPRQSFMCMEGGISKSFYEYFEKCTVMDDTKIRIMYSGILEKVTGIDLLIDAFLKLENSNVELIITGDGSLAEWILKKEEKCSKIKYLGCLPYEQYMDKLVEADILVNPRNMNLPENANNFPSKIMEYLATGKIIVSTKFPGWDRYQKYIKFCDSTVEDISVSINQCINSIKEWDKQRDNNRKYAQTFLWDAQVSRMGKFIQKDLR